MSDGGFYPTAQAAVPGVSQGGGAANTGPAGSSTTEEERLEQVKIPVRRGRWAETGALPSRWGTESVDAPSFRTMLYQLTPYELSQLQRQMYMAGFYGKGAILEQDVPSWGVLDQDTLAAANDLIYTAVGYAEHDTPRSIEELLNERATSMAGVHAQAAASGGGADLGAGRVIRLTDPVALEESAQDWARSQFHRELTPDELSAISGVVSARERANEEQFAAMEDAANRDYLYGQYVDKWGIDPAQDWLAPTYITKGGEAGTGAQVARGLADTYGLVTTGVLPRDKAPAGLPEAAEGLAFSFTGSPEQVAQFRADMDKLTAPGQMVVRVIDGNVDVAGGAIASERQMGAARTYGQMGRRSAGAVAPIGDGRKGETWAMIRQPDGTVVYRKMEARNGRSVPVGEVAEGSRVTAVTTLTADVNFAAADTTDPGALEREPALDQPWVKVSQAGGIKGAIRDSLFDLSNPVDPDPETPVAGDTGDGQGGPKMAGWLDRVVNNAKAAVGPQTVTVVLREGAQAPQFSAGRLDHGDALERFLRASRGQGEEVVEGRSPWMLPDRLVRKEAARLGIDVTKLDEQGHRAIAQSVADRLWTKYRDWDKVALAWVGGEGPVDHMSKTLTSDQQAYLAKANQLGGFQTAMSVLNRQRNAILSRMNDPASNEPDPVSGLTSTLPNNGIPGFNPTGGGIAGIGTDVDPMAQAQREAELKVANELHGGRLVKNWEKLMLDLTQPGV